MKILQRLFGFMWMIGFIGNGILFMYVEWMYIRQNFFNIINPLIYPQVMITLLTTPLFWILLIIAMSGHFGVTKLETKIAKEIRTKSVKKGIGGWLLLIVIFITIINPLLNSAIFLFLFFSVPIGTYMLNSYTFYPTIISIGWCEPQKLDTMLSKLNQLTDFTFFHFIIFNFTFKFFWWHIAK